MKRIDSGFDSSAMISTSGRPSTDRSRTDGSRRRRGNKSTPHSSPLSSPFNTEAQRESPQNTNHSDRRRKSAEAGRQSIGSSEQSTSKSKRPGYSSKPSSRRTCTTLVDPSRPARDYRIRSSQTVPTTRDVDDVLALHFRSCSLFQNPSYQVHPSLSSDAIDASVRTTRASPTTATAPQTSLDRIDTNTTAKQSEETILPVEMTNTIMHWTSPSTRRREYEKIDRRNSGLRGAMRKVLPRCISGPPPPRFYEKDQSDAGSVRRYRMDIPDSEDEGEADEKNTASFRQRNAKPTSAKKKTKKWICF